MAKRLSDEWSAPQERREVTEAERRAEERDEQDESYFLASSDVVLGLTQRQAALLTDFLSHDMDMITVVAPDANEDDVLALRRQLEGKVASS